MQKIAPGVFVETRFSPYNVGVIAAGNYAVAVDMPPRPSDTQQWTHEIKTAVGPIRYVVLTDSAPERLIGAALCRRQLIATEATLRHLNSFEDRAWRDLTHSVAAKYADESSTIHALTPYRTAIAGDALLLHSSVGTLQFEAVANVTPGALWLTLPQHHLLFAGDGVASDAPPPLSAIVDSGAWMETLSRLMQRKQVYHIVPGRGKAPMMRGEIEQQREFLRVMRRTAHNLTRRHGELGYSEAAHDLGQAFFNQRGQKAVKLIKQGLMRMVEEIQVAQMPPEETADTEMELLE